MFSRGVETLRIDGYLALVLLTHGELVSFHRLMKYGEPLSMGKTHSSIDTYSYKCAAGLKTLLVEYLPIQNRHMTGEEKNPKTREEWREANGGYQDKLMDDSSQENERLNASKIRGAGNLENA